MYIKLHQASTKKFYGAKVGRHKHCQNIDDSFRVCLVHLIWKCYYGHITELRRIWQEA